MLRRGTSVFANYGEARAAESRRDFVHKMRICLKELRETRTWLKFLQYTGRGPTQAVAAAHNECSELVAIFVASIRTADHKG